MTMIVLNLPWVLELWKVIFKKKRSQHNAVCLYDRCCLSANVLPCCKDVEYIYLIGLIESNNGEIIDILVLW